MMLAADTALFCHDARDREELGNAFDLQPVLFGHSLHTLDLFQMPALLQLAEKAMQHKGRSHYESGDKRVNDYFGRPPEGVTIRQALQQIALGNNWVILKRIHEEPAYQDFLESCIDRLSEITSVDLRRNYNDPILTVFVTSPNRTTPYHMDSEANFLAQVCGTKSVYLFDGNDRSILSCQDLERYWTGHFDAAVYRDELKTKGVCYQLSPGYGVFNPATFPHWVQNGNAVSVSVSINFKRLRNPEVGAYCTNYYMRKLGLKPTDPGRSPGLDRIKDATFGNAYWTARRLRKRMLGAIRSKPRG